jgi:hypothetical protein
MRMPSQFRRGTALVLALGLTRCGSISYETNDTTSPAVGGDGGAGSFGGGDGGPGSIGAGADAGTNCRPREAPPIQMRWPFQMTIASYEFQFAANLPDRSGCSIQSCHGGSAGANNTWLPPVSTPLIPPPNAVLDATSVQSAIEGLWARVLPTLDQTPPPSQPTPPLIWHHALPPDGANQPPMLSPLQLTYLKGFIERARDCGWVTTQMQERGLPPQNCVNGLCDCPITVDLSYCSQ